jgi:pimeloyl-ACP methyl ester carboxylesterase
VDLPTDQPDLLPDDYAKVIRRQVEGVIAPVVVAHSGSGVLLPAAARALDARHQVWLAAWVPDPKASLVEEVAARTDAFNPDWLGKDPTSDPGIAAEFLFHDCDPERLDWALTTLRLFLPRAAYEHRVVLADDVPSTYILSSLDRTIRPGWQRRVARERLKIEALEIPVGHCAHVSRPDAVADILVRLSA